MKLELYNIIGWFQENSEWEFVGEHGITLRFRNESLDLEADFWFDMYQITWYSWSPELRFCGTTYIKTNVCKVAASCPSSNLSNYIQTISKEILTKDVLNEAGVV